MEIEQDDHAYEHSKDALTRRMGLGPATREEKGRVSSKRETNGKKAPVHARSTLEQENAKLKDRVQAAEAERDEARSLLEALKNLIQKAEL